MVTTQEESEQERMVRQRERDANNWGFRIEERWVRVGVRVWRGYRQKRDGDMGKGMEVLGMV